MDSFGIQIERAFLKSHFLLFSDTVFYVYGGLWVLGWSYQLRHRFVEPWLMASRLLEAFSVFISNRAASSAYSRPHIVTVW